MLTYEDVTAYFLKAASSFDIVTHPEYWTNTRSLEREFACTCHMGSCEEAETQSSCTLSFTWSTLDTALSLEGPIGICDFFHEPDENCPHLHTNEIPPFVLDLAYSSPLSMNGTHVYDTEILSLIQMLKLRASEQSSRAIETRPGVTLTLHENRLQAETLTLQQRVELPIWHPQGMHGLHDELHYRTDRLAQRRSRTVEDDDDETDEIVADNPRPEDWLPTVLEDVCQDIMKVLEALDSVRTTGSLN
jgi:hypothetical protein